MASRGLVLLATWGGVDDVDCTKPTTTTTTTSVRRDARKSLWEISVSVSVSQIEALIRRTVIVEQSSLDRLTKPTAN